MRSRRIHLSRADFTKVLSDCKTRRASTAHFSAVYSTAGIGCAVVVSKKVAKSSVARHLLKRRVREASASHNGGNGALIIYARVGASTLPYSEVLSEISTLLPRVVA